MERRQKSKKLCCMILSFLMLCSLVSGVTLNTGTAYADSSDDTTNSQDNTYDKIMNPGEPEGYDETDKVNPYSNDNQKFLLVEQNELMINMSWNIDEDKDNNWITMADTYENGGSMELASSNANDKAGWQSVTGIEESKTPVLNYQNGIAFDPNGTGRKDHVAYVGWKDNHNYLWVYDTTTQTASELYELDSSLSIGSWDDVNYLTAQNLYSITAGDYNDDGIDTLVVYNPADEGNFSVQEYRYKDGAFTQLGSSQRVLHDVYCSESKIYKVNKFYNKLGCNLTTGDFDGDGVDDLGVVSYGGDLRNVDADLDQSIYAPMIAAVFGEDQDGKSGGEDWSVIKSGDMQKVYGEINKRKEDSCIKYDSMRSPSISAGDVDGNGYDELICAGFYSCIQEEEGSFSYDTEVNYEKTTAVAVAVSRDTISIAGNTFASNEWSKNSARHHDFEMKVQVATECVALNGQSAADTVFINGSFCQYIGSGGGFVEIYTPNYFDTDDKGIGGAETAAMAVTDVVSGVFDGNAYGREQVMFTVSQREWGKVTNNDIYVTFGAMGGKDYDDDTNIAGGYYSSDIDGDHYSISNKGDSTDQYLNACLVAMDNDKDGVLAEYKDKDYLYADPKAVTVLQAGPAFSDLDEYGGYDCTCETSYSMSTTYERGTSSGDSISFSTGFDVEVAIGILKAKLELSARLGYALDWNQNFEDSVATTYTTSFSSQTHDQVVVSRIPVTIYNYIIYDENGDAQDDAFAIASPGKPVYYQLGVDEYNDFVDEYNSYVNTAAKNEQEMISENPVNLKKINKDTASDNGVYDLPADNTGKPENFFTSWAQAGEGSTNFSQSPVALSYNNGSSSSEWSKTESSTASTDMGHGFSFDGFAGGSGSIVEIVDLKAGIYASLEYLHTSGSYETNASEKGAIGTVQNLNEAALIEAGLSKEVVRSYAFQWEFGAWKRELTTVSGEYTPFFGYRVWNVTRPPHAPENLQADYSNTNGLTSVDLTWDAIDDSYNVLQGYNVYQKEDGEYIKLNDSLIKGDSKKSTVSYTVENLKTNKDYTFVVTSVAYLDLSGVDKTNTGESLWSNEAKIKTARSNYTITLTNDRGSRIEATSGGKTIADGDKVYEGDAVFVKAEAKSGYTIKKILLKKSGEDDVDITSTAGEFNFVVSGDTEIEVTTTRAVDESEVFYSTEGKGSIVSAMVDGVKFNSGATISGDVTLKAKADEGYVLKEWQVTTGSATQTFAANGNNTFTFAPFASQHKVKAVFVSEDDSAVVRTIQLTEITGGGHIQVSDSNGKVLTADASGKIKVNVGTPVTFKAKADSSYVFRGWTGDFASISKENTEVDYTIYEDLSVGAEFYAPVKYKVSYGVNNASYGTIETDIKNDSLHVPGESLTFKAVPKDGCRLEYWKVVKGDETSKVETKELKSEYKLNLDVEDTTKVTACFKKIEEYKLNIAESEYGEIEVTNQNDKKLSNGDKILYGDVLKVKAEPKQYHELKVLNVNGNKTENGSKVTVYSNVSVDAEYVRLLSKDGEVLPDVKATLAFSSAKYTGEEIKPGVTLEVGGKTLKEGTDYTVTYKDNKEPGKATVTIEGKGFYKGTVVETFEIIERFTLSISSNEFGAIKVVNQDKGVLKDGDYIYEGDVLNILAEPDKYCELTTFKVNGKNATSGTNIVVDKNISAEAEFVRLLSKDGKALPDVKATLAFSSAKYTGSAIKPDVTVKVDGKTLKSKDYSVSYSDNKLPGKATVKVTGKGSYKGTVKTTFTIKDNSELYKTELYKYTKITASSSKVTVKWGEVKAADGYDVFLAKCGTDFSSKPAVTTTKTSVSVTKISGKKVNSKYNYKSIVKAYRMENGTKKYITTSYTIHAAGPKSSGTNPTEITGVPSSKSLNVGKTYKIKASVKKSNKSKSLLTSHAATFRYKTSDSAVATVSSSGTIKAKGKGTCTITVVTINGISKQIKVTVK